MKKHFLFVVVFLLTILAFGCDDAKKKNNPTNDDELQTLNKELESQDIDKITVKGLGDVVEFFPFECSFLEVKTTSNINDVRNLTKQDIADIVVKDVIDSFGPDSGVYKRSGKMYVNADGEVDKDKFKSFLLIRMKVKNTSDNPMEICIFPGFYKDDEAGKYIPCTSEFADITIGNVQQTGADKYFYEFKPGEEQEFVLTYAILSISDDYNIYVDTRFIRISECTDPKIIPDGSIFVKVLSKK